MQSAVHCQHMSTYIPIHFTCNYICRVIKFYCIVTPKYIYVLAACRWKTITKGCYNLLEQKQTEREWGQYFVRRLSHFWLTSWSWPPLWRLLQTLCAPSCAWPQPLVHESCLCVHSKEDKIKKPQNFVIRVIQQNLRKETFDSAENEIAAEHVKWVLKMNAGYLCTYLNTCMVALFLLSFALLFI